MDRDQLDEALATLGEVLEDRHQVVHLYVVGGASLQLRSWIERATQDVDVMGIRDDGGWRRGDPLPRWFVEEVAAVGAALDLGPTWLNVEPESDFPHLPADAIERATIQRYGGLVLHLAARRELVAMKLNAAADDVPMGKHFQDLVDLDPTPDELVDAAAWCVATELRPEPRRSLVEGVIGRLEEVRRG